MTLQAAASMSLVALFLVSADDENSRVVRDVKPVPQ